MTSDEQLQDLYNKQFDFAVKLSEEHSPLEVAAIMMTQALSIYRSALSDEEYNAMVDTISDSRSLVKTFQKVQLQ